MGIFSLPRGSRVFSYAEPFLWAARRGDGGFRYQDAGGEYGRGYAPVQHVMKWEHGHMLSTDLERLEADQDFSPITVLRQRPKPSEMPGGGLDVKTLQRCRTS